MKKTVSLLLVALLLLSLFSGCGKTPATDGELTAEQKAILQRRRDDAESYMRQMMTIMWRSDADITYTIEGVDYNIKAGRLYRGLPYVYACGTKASFLEFAGEPDANGIYPISGLKGPALNGGSTRARIGNDCSSAVTDAWSRSSSTLKSTRSSLMQEVNGVVPVGDYKFEPVIDPETGLITDTFKVISLNGAQVMYQAYAQLQKADAIFYVGSSNHTRMVVSVNVVYKEDGTIDPAKSTVTTLEQTRNNFRNERTTTHPETGEIVYYIGGVDVEYSFTQLLGGSYLPVTCAAFVDPTISEEPKITDSETSFTKDTIFTGTLASNMYIDSVIITIEDSSGKVVQKAAAGTARALYANKQTQLNFDLQQFVTDSPESIRGKIDLSALAPGSYRCKTVCRMTTEKEIPVRDFTFTVE